MHLLDMTEGVYVHLLDMHEGLYVHLPGMHQAATFGGILTESSQC